MSNERISVAIERQGLIDLEEKVTAMARFNVDDITEPFVFHNIIPRVSENSYAQMAFSCYAKMAQIEGTGRIMIGGQAFDLDEVWQRIEVVFQSYSPHFQFRFLTTGSFDIALAQLEIGNKVTDYGFSQEDYYTSDEITSQITQTGSEINLAIKNVAGDTSEISQRLDSITARVSNAEGKLIETTQDLNGVTFYDPDTGKTLIDGSKIYTKYLSLERLEGKRASGSSEYTSYVGHSISAQITQDTYITFTDDTCDDIEEEFPNIRRQMLESNRVNVKLKEFAVPNCNFDAEANVRARVKKAFPIKLSSYGDYSDLHNGISLVPNWEFTDSSKTSVSKFYLDYAYISTSYETTSSGSTTFYGYVGQNRIYPIPQSGSSSIGSSIYTRNDSATSSSSRDYKDKVYLFEYALGHTSSSPLLKAKHTPFLSMVYKTQYKYDYTNLENYLSDNGATYYMPNSNYIKVTGRKIYPDSNGVFDAEKVCLCHVQKIRSGSSTSSFVAYNIYTIFEISVPANQQHAFEATPKWVCVTPVATRLNDDRSLLRLRKDCSTHEWIPYEDWIEEYPSRDAVEIINYVYTNYAKMRYIGDEFLEGDTTVRHSPINWGLKMESDGIPLDVLQDKFTWCWCWSTNEDSEHYQFINYVGDSDYIPEMGIKINNVSYEFGRLPLSDYPDEDWLNDYKLPTDYYTNSSYWIGSWNVHDEFNKRYSDNSIACCFDAWHEGNSYVYEQLYTFSDKTGQLRFTPPNNSTTGTITYDSVEDKYGYTITANSLDLNTCVRTIQTYVEPTLLPNGDLIESMDTWSCKTVNSSTASSALVTSVTAEVADFIYIDGDGIIEPHLLETSPERNEVSISDGFRFCNDSHKYGTIFTGRYYDDDDEFPAIGYFPMGFYGIRYYNVWTEDGVATRKPSHTALGVLSLYNAPYPNQLYHSNSVVTLGDMFLDEPLNNFSRYRELLRVPYYGALYEEHILVYRLRLLDVDDNELTIVPFKVKSLYGNSSSYVTVYDEELVLITDDIWGNVQSSIKENTCKVELQVYCPTMSSASNSYIYVCHNNAVYSNEFTQNIHGYELY